MTKFNFKKIAKKFGSNLIFKKFLIAAGLLVFALAAIFFIFNFKYENKILPHAYIGETNFGGLDRLQAKEKILQLISQQDQAQLAFFWQDKDYQQSLTNLELAYNSDETLAKLLAVGRSGTLKKVLQETFRSIFTRNTLSASYTLNETKLNDFLKTIALDVDKIEKDATIEIHGLEPMVVSEEIGQKFPLAENKKIVEDHLGSFRFGAIMPFVIVKVYPKIDLATAKKALGETQELLSRQLVLEAANGKTFQIYPKDVAGFLEFVARLNSGVLASSEAKEIVNPYRLSPEISPTKVYPFVEQISAEVYQEPRDSQFRASDGRVVAFQLAQTGYELDKEKAVNAIIEGLKSDQKSLDLPVKVTEPKIFDDDPEKLGLKEIVGEGTTNFSGSPENRRHNIAVGAKTFDGVLIKPGEEFSMLKYLGPVEASTGYLPELVIKEDRTIPEYGGGLCQVSTTMFRAALNTGLKITERQNHSYRVRYYEPPVGMDATIYIPKPDLKFVNDFSSYLLIQAVIGDDDLTFRFYGTKDGRRSETTEPYVYDVTGSGEPIYTESPDLAPGEIKRIETAHPGSKATFTYRVYDALGKLTNEQVFQSSYTPWPARYLYGPGTQIPPPPEE